MSGLIEPLDDAVLEEKRDKLRALLNRLADDYDKYPDKTVESLLEIYSGGYRQMYSDIFPIIVDIRSRKQKGGLDFLTDNLESVRAHIKDMIQSSTYSREEVDSELNSYTELYGKVLKLSDHVNLEVQRLDDSEGIRADTRKTVEILQDRISKTQNDLKKARSKVRKMQTEVIMILGIFAAIVMAMSGGLTLMGSSMEGMSTTGVYKIAFVIILCGFVIFNTIAFLMTYIHRMVAELYENEKSQGRWSKTIVSVISNNRFIIAFDIMLIFMLLIDLFCWAESNYPMA